MDDFPRLAIQTFPHNVVTQWNSMFNMLDFALEYQVVIDGNTDKYRLGLSEHALDKKEWGLLE